MNKNGNKTENLVGYNLYCYLHNSDYRFSWNNKGIKMKFMREKKKTYPTHNQRLSPQPERSSLSNPKASDNNELQIK